MEQISINQTFGIIIIFFVSIFFFLIAVNFGFQKKTEESYLVSSRNENVFRLTATFTVSALGAWILFGPPTASTFGGYGSIVGYAFGAASPMLFLIFFGKKIRSIFPRGTSLSQLIQKKFSNNVSKFILFIMIFYLFIFLCAEITAISKLFYKISNTPVWLTAIIILFSTLFYVVLGGLKATIRSDTIQFIIIILLFFILLSFISTSYELNIDTFFSNSQENKTSLLSFFQYGFLFFIAVCATNLLHQGNWQRVYAAKNNTVLTNSLLISFFIIFLIVFVIGLTGILAKNVNIKFSEDLVFFSIILFENNFLITIVVLIFALCLTISTVDTLLNSISSLLIVHSKDFFKHSKIYTNTISFVIIISLSLIAFIIALKQLSVLYLFLIADYLCCACIYVVFKKIFFKNISNQRSLILIITALIFGGIFFPSMNFENSLLVGFSINVVYFPDVIKNQLLFWSFFLAFAVPFVMDKIFNSFEKLKKLSSYFLHP